MNKEVHFQSQVENLRSLLASGKLVDVVRLARSLDIVTYPLAEAWEAMAMLSMPQFELRYAALEKLIALVQNDNFKGPASRYFATLASSILDE